MFKLTRPCANCPFRKGMGARFRLPRLRLREIFRANAFQCHKTVDYGKFDDAEKRQGDNPQQCAGLMSILHRDGQPNQMMQVGERLGAFNPSKLDHTEVYKSRRSATAAHTKGDNYD